MRKWLVFMLVALLLPCCALAQDAADVPGGYIRFDGELPETLRPAFSGEEWADDKPLVGYVFTRFDKWSYANIIMEGDTGRTLCCLFWYGDHWELTASSAAIPQDGTPVLEIEELEWYKTEEERDQFNLGSEFNVYFEDSASPFTWFNWFHGSNGWCLRSMVGYQQGISFTTRSLVWNGEPIYNKRDILLESFVLEEFPSTVEEARALAEADPVLNDSTAGIVVYTETADSDWGRSDVCPCAPVYDAASRSAKQVAWMADDTAVTVLEERDGFVRIRVGNEEPGWVLRENIKIGLERVTQYLSFSRVRVLGEAGTETESVYDVPNGSVCGEISTRKVVAMTLMSMDGAWVYVMDTETGVNGWIPSGKAGLTDNYATCVVQNDEPENRLHLRAAPSRQAESLGKYYTGVTVDMIWQEKAVDGWRKVSVAGNVGWMNTEYLNFGAGGNHSRYLPPLRKVRGAVGGEGANLRAAADSAAAVIRRLPNGTPVEILGISDDWGHIRLKDGTTGWMRLHLLGGEPEKADSAAVRLQKDVNASAASDFVLPAGTTVYLQERPIAQWHYPNAVDGDWETVVYGVPATTFVYMDDSGAHVATEDIDCGW